MTDVFKVQKQLKIAWQNSGRAPALVADPKGPPWGRVAQAAGQTLKLCAAQVPPVSVTGKTDFPHIETQHQRGWRKTSCCMMYKLEEKWKNGKIIYTFAFVSSPLLTYILSREKVLTAESCSSPRAGKQTEKNNKQKTKTKEDQYGEQIYVPSTS